MTLRIRVRWPRDHFTLAVDTELPLAGVTALYGRSGCGKTSLLRVIAGLERVAGAEIHFGTSCWQGGGRFVPIQQRHVGLVFQEHSLLPHLSVVGNLLYGYRRSPAARRRLHLDTVVRWLELEDWLTRGVEQLSGGQRQRVALGRALLSNPDLLLLDEPLAALDSQSKRDILPLLSRLAAEAEIPVLLITHAADEVQRLADRVLFMEEGRLSAMLPLQEALVTPDSPLFLDEGPSSVLLGTLGDIDAEGLQNFHSQGLRLQVRSGRYPEAGECRLRILARDVSLALVDPGLISIQNHVRVRIDSLHALPEHRVLVRLQLPDTQIMLAEITPQAVAQLQLQPGLEVWALIKSVALML